MKHLTWITRSLRLTCAWLVLLTASAADAQSNPMTCIECHVDPAAGNVHGGFRGLKDLTDDEVDVMCLSCHNGTIATEAAVHEGGLDRRGNPESEYGLWKAGCLDCHTQHSPLLAGDGTANTNLKLLGLRVLEASSTDRIARIRKPIINDQGNGDASDDVQTGWEADSGIPDDPTVVETDPPAAGDHVRKLVFYTDIDTAATNWVQSSPPYNGACNSCHTRTDHHRRDDSGGDHTHKIPQPCTNCHDHSAGWTNKGG